MTLKGLIYEFPSIYDFILNILHGKHLSERYEFIANEIGKNKKVLEVGCGTCMLSSFLHKSNKYFGIDDNDKSLNYASKKRGVKNLIKSNIFNFSKYPKVDVIVACDVLHHIYPKHEYFLNKLMTKSKKVIVCEPFGGGIGGLFDSDGINKNDSDNGPIGWGKRFSEKQNVVDFFKTFNSQKIKLTKHNIIAVLGKI